MKKILLIEDNKEVRENTAIILELANYDVTTAENGKTGIHKAVEVIPDLILCDIMMPEMDGFEVFLRLSEKDITADIPFIFLTALSGRSDMRKGMNLGADDYLTKPFEEEELLEAIQSRLKKHSFLKKKFSKDLVGISEFLNQASKHLDLKDLSKNRTLKTYKIKEDIYMEGSAAHHLYFIEKGTVKTYRITEKGKEFVTGLHSAGDFIGQLSLLGHTGTYIETATVLERAKICEIPKADFMSLLYGNRDVSNKFISMISNNMVDLQDQLINMAFSSVRQRTAKALLDLQRKGIIKNEKNPGVGIPREDFAGIIGTATETAIRMLSEFKDEGLITTESLRKIVLLDRKSLLEIAEFG